VDEIRISIIISGHGIAFVRQTVVDAIVHVILVPINTSTRHWNSKKNYYCLYLFL